MEVNWIPACAGMTGDKAEGGSRRMAAAGRLNG